MSNPLYAFPAACEQTIRALARDPERTAFSWPGGSITYRGATDMIGNVDRDTGHFLSQATAPAVGSAP